MVDNSEIFQSNENKIYFPLFWLNFQIHLRAENSDDPTQQSRKMNKIFKVCLENPIPLSNWNGQLMRNGAE